MIPEINLQLSVPSTPVYTARRSDGVLCGINDQMFNTQIWIGDEWSKNATW